MVHMEKCRKKLTRGIYSSSSVSRDIVHNCIAKYATEPICICREDRKIDSTSLRFLIDVVKGSYDAVQILDCSYRSICPLTLILRRGTATSSPAILSNVSGNLNSTTFITSNRFSYVEVNSSATTDYCITMNQLGGTSVTSTASGLSAYFRITRIG